MGCAWSRCWLKHDEISPISIRPIKISNQSHAKTSNSALITEEPAITQQPRQVTLTDEITPNKSSNKNGSAILTSEAPPAKFANQNDSSTADSVALTNEIALPNSINQNEAVVTNESALSNSTNKNDSAAVTSTNYASTLSETVRETEKNVPSSDQTENVVENSAEEENTVSSIKEKESESPDEQDVDDDENRLRSEEVGQGQQPEASSLTNQTAVVDGTVEDGVEDQINDSTVTTPVAQEDEAGTSASADTEAAGAGFQMPELVVEKVPDGEGCPITLGTLFGTWTVPWPSLPEQILRAQFFHFDDSDVILTGYAKSGSHWLWEMVHMLMKGEAVHCRTPKERLMLSFSTQEYFDTLPPPRVFNTHAPFEGFPAAVREGKNKCKMIYLLRNPKDLAVSYYHHLINQVDFEYEGTFHGYLDLFLEGKVPGGSWFDYVLGWEKTLEQRPELSVLVLHYEDIKENTVAALQKVNEFLDLGRDLSLLTEIADQCTIGRMKAVDEELKEQGPQHVNVSKTGKNFILRKGEVGDWQNWFSEEDDRRFMEAVRDKLGQSRLRFRYRLDDREKEEKEEECEKEEEEEKGEEKMEEE